MKKEEILALIEPGKGFSFELEKLERFILNDYSKDLLFLAAKKICFMCKNYGMPEKTSIGYFHTIGNQARSYGNQARSRCRAS